jgi:hypothetical protein
MCEHSNVLSVICSSPQQNCGVFVKNKHQDYIKKSFYSVISLLRRNEWRNHILREFNLRLKVGFWRGVFTAF